MTIRPAPRRGVYERPFWDYVQQERLHLQRCARCGHVWYPPGPACPSCLSEAWSWKPVSGRGSLLSWATFHRQYFDTLAPPYTIVAAELEEGPILITDLAAPPPSLRIGMRLRLSYAQFETSDGGQMLLYQWMYDH